MADPYATQAPDLSGRPAGPAPWRELIGVLGGTVVGPEGGVGEGSFVVIECSGIGTLAPLSRVAPALAALLWIEHSSGSPSAAAANALRERLDSLGAPLLAIKQGCVAGPQDRAGCYEIDAAMIGSVLPPALAGEVEWETDPDFGYEVPAVVPNLNEECGRALLPRLLYADHDRVYEHAELVVAKKRERAAIAAGLPGLDGRIAAASGWPAVPSPGDWRE